MHFEHRSKRTWQTKLHCDTHRKEVSVGSWLRTEKITVFLHWGRLAGGRSVLCRASIRSFLWAYRAWVTTASTHKVYHRYSAFSICVTGQSMACAEQETHVHWERTRKHGQGHFGFYVWCLLLNQPSSSMCPEMLTPSLTDSLEDISEDWSEVFSRWMETMTGKSKTGIGWLVLWKSLKLSYWDYLSLQLLP